MAPKSSTTKENLLEGEEEVLQAVILTDSFNRRFRPLTTHKPRCLLPICNAPLLDWTFESLALAGVQEVFVICRSHATLVKKAISDSKWSKASSGMKIVPIMTAKETYSPGDAMRDIYTRGLVTSDFILVMGDLVSNIQIDEVVRVHKERRKTNKNAIMTMVVKETGLKHRTRAKGESAVFVIDPDTSECLHYEHLLGYPRQKRIGIPREILAGHPEIEIRYDLLDCSIDVCSVEVPSLFQDNFDYQDLRRDFVHGVLTSDLLMKSIHVYVAEEGYAARVQDTRSYESISKDILSRWTFPLVPDDNHPGGHVYEHTRGNRYIAKDNTVVLAQTANIGTNTLIGSSSKIAENVSIAASVIGQRCSIGPGTTIKNSYIFDDSTIGANCKIERSILGAGVVLKDGSVVAKGCLLGDGVVVGPNATLPQFERLSTRQVRAADPSKISASENQEESDMDDEEADSDIEDVDAQQDSIDKATLGKDTNAIVWPKGPPDEEDDEEGPENWKNQRLMRIGEDSTEEAEEEEDYSTSGDEDSEDDFHDRESLSGVSDVSIPFDMPQDKIDREFQGEVKQSLERAFAEGHSTDNAAVELKTLRMASNVPLRRVKEAVIGAIVERVKVVEGDMGAQRTEIALVMTRWGELISKIGGFDAVETVTILQEHCATSSRMSLFGQILAALYQEDIVEEDHIRKWHRLPESKGENRKDSVETDNFKKCWTIGSHLINQFDAQDSEEDDSEEDDSEEEESESKVGDNTKDGGDASEEHETTDSEQKDTDTETESEADGPSTSIPSKTENVLQKTRITTDVEAAKLDDALKTPTMEHKVPPSLTAAVSSSNQLPATSSSTASRQANSNPPPPLSESETDSEVTDSTDAADASASEEHSEEDSSAAPSTNNSDDESSA